jgi:intergrase/recombinase
MTTPSRKSSRTLLNKLKDYVQEEQKQQFEQDLSDYVETFQPQAPQSTARRAPSSTRKSSGVDGVQRLFGGDNGKEIEDMITSLGDRFENEMKALERTNVEYLDHVRSEIQKLTTNLRRLVLPDNSKLLEENKKLRKIARDVIDVADSFGISGADFSIPKH